jgi:kynureninase
MSTAPRTSELVLPGGHPFSSEEGLALALDAADPLAGFRRAFELPRGPDGSPLVYLLGNSLGAMPLDARAEVEAILAGWGRHGVDGWTDAAVPWMRYQDALGESLGRVVGAAPDEVVTMNTLTVNLHLMLASFYRPAGPRVKVLMEEKPFPSDRYAVASHLRLRGVDPDDAVVFARPRAGESWLRSEDLEALIAERGPELALVLLAGVNYYTGQWFDLPRVVQACRRAGCLVGFDLAHAAGNVPLALHEWDADFAVWCSYKYLNAGPGAIAGAFVHRRHAGDPSVLRLQGWWGNEPSTRFAMRPDFVAPGDASGWQISTPPVLAIAPLRASLALFDRAGMTALRRKSEALTAYLEGLLEAIPGNPVRMLTPREPAARGCQLSLQVSGRARWLHDQLRQEGIVTDYREPDVIRMAPVPFYNTFHDVWRTARAVRAAFQDPAAPPAC